MSDPNHVVRTSIYAKAKVISDFKRICKREGHSMSGKIEDFMVHYAQAHSNGNPQLKIISYAAPESPQPMRVRCLFIGGVISDGRILCRRAGVWIPGIRCYSCDKNELRKQK